MAKCDEGYRCAICGQDVESICDSGLYLRYVLGDLLLEKMHTVPEHHIRCVPELAQYICTPEFEPVSCVGPFSKAELDAAFVQQETQRVTGGWRHLQQLPTLGLSLLEYPLAVLPASIPLEENRT